LDTGRSFSCAEALPTKRSARSTTVGILAQAFQAVHPPASS
jgi:hypothetical protein